MFAIHALAAWRVARGSRSLILGLVRRMRELRVKRPFDSVVASFLTVPSVLLLLHFAIVLTLQMRGHTSSLAPGPRQLLIVSSLFLAPLAVICGVWAVVYSFTRAGVALCRYACIALNALPVGIGFLYVAFILFLARMGPINAG